MQTNPEPGCRQRISELTTARTSHKWKDNQPINQGKDQRHKMARN